jgi:hypothetical protein
MESITTHQTNDLFQTAFGSYFGVIAKKQTYLNLAYLLARSICCLFDLLIIMVIVPLAFILAATTHWIITRLVYDPGPVLKLAPFVINGLLAIPLIALLAYPATVLEQKMAFGLLQLRFPIAPFWSSGSSLGAAVGRYFASKPAWKRVLFLLLRVPLGVLSFIAVMILLPLTIILLTMPVVYLTGLHDLIFWELRVNRFGESMALSLMAILLVPFVLHLSNLLSRFSGWLAKELLPG